MTLTFGSLFAGIGGMDLGLERAGLVCRWQVEIDDYCRRVLTKHWPDVPKYGDIREVSGEGLERVDLICGGFPCQDISIAGKQAGIDGERSGLWSEYVRLIRVVRPRYVLVENVPNLLALGMGRVLGDLAESGYDAEWDCIPASAVGAHHLRDRTFIVAYAHGIGLEGRVYQRARVGVEAFPTPTLWRNPATPYVCRGTDGIPNWLDRLRVLGNAVVPQVAEWIGRRLVGAL
ncbi:MAG: DNA (cytosine-5-)-methyltransferase [Gemmatimonadales bacterium]|nr:DNA (cytosine-5-)-methyltransferase [Gemmatimonadales bacterium]